MEEFAPAENSYIDVRNFVDVAELAEFLLHLHGNETARQVRMRRNVKVQV